MIINNVDLFIVLSEFQKSRFIDGGIHPDRIEILPNIAPTVNGSEINQNDEKLIAFVGRVSTEKGISSFIKAARILPNYVFTVAGSTNAMAGIENTAPSNVEFKGFLSGAKLHDFFRKIKIFVFPSAWFEGFPNAVASAMAYGIPVIASRIGALPEIVEDGVTGLLFEAGNTVDFVEKIKYLCDRPKLCREMGRAGSEKARREYSKEKYYERLLAIYEKARKFRNEG
jgi:glycosyltransferase involved in cell wall biosynthesis